MSNTFDCVVIGAGHNGLTAAATLAKRGQKVLVVEKNFWIGGLAGSEEFCPGYRSAGVLNDTTSVRRRVVDELALKKFGLSLADQPPSVFAPARTGKGLLLHHDAKRAADEIAAYSSTDARRYQEYRSFFKRISPFLERVFDDVPPDVYSMNFYGLWDLMKKAVGLRMLGKSDMTELLRIGPMCVADWLNEWFEHDLLKATLAGPAVYGSFAGPWSPSTNANLILYEAMGCHAVQGGPAALVKALEKAARASGVTIDLGREVKRIIVQDGRAVGVELLDGEKISCRTVASSCDPKQTFLKLLSQDHVSYQLNQRITNLRARGTTAKINLALNQPLEFSCRPELHPAYARLGESLDDIERAFDAVKYGQFSQRPALDIYVPTLDDPTLAPSGHHVASILVHFAAYDLQGGWNDAQKEKLFAQTMAVLSEYAPHIGTTVVGKEVLSPRDLEQRYGLSQGHLYHGEHAADQIILRPTPECAKYATPVPGLFLSGSGSHPGGGISCAPGSLSARAILASL